MKLTVGQKNFRRALSLIEPIIGKTAALPILADVVLKTEGGRLKVAATNLEIGITCFIGAKTDEVGEIAVPGRILNDVIQSIEEETVVLSTKSNTLHITSKAHKTAILGTDTKEYPIIPKISAETLFSMGAPALKDLLASVVDAIATSESRPELSGLLLVAGSGTVTCAATDSFRLAEKITKGKVRGSAKVIIPRATAIEVLRLTADDALDISVAVGDNQIAFTSQDCQIISRLIDGNYPDYKKVIPEKWASKALISRTQLERNVRLAGLFSSSISDVTVSCEDGTLSVTARNSDKGEVQATTDAVLKNDAFSLALNFHYLLDGLKAITTEKVVVEFTGDGSPLIIRPADDKNEFTYLIMPLRR
ncbi:MAG: DNA polymerase III subunit beta [Patescibacteria group bacterium]